MIGDRGIDTVFVERVDKTATAKPGCFQYVVTAQTLASPPRAVQYSTVNEFRAAQCIWGRDSEWPLIVAWRRGKFGREIIAVDKARRQRSA